MDLHISKSPVSEKHIFRCWFACACVHASVFSITQRPITAETPNLAFYVIPYVDATKGFLERSDK